MSTDPKYAFPLRSAIHPVAHHLQLSQTTGQYHSVKGTVVEAVSTSLVFPDTSLIDIFHL